MSDESRELMERLVEGDSQAAKAVYERYAQRLIALAQTRIAARLTPKFDPEDVVQSAYRSFFVRAVDGQFVIQRGGDLWRLLAQITLNKVRKSAARHATAKRDARRQTALTDQTASLEPSPEEIGLALDLMESWMTQLDARRRDVLQRRMVGESVHEIAEAQGVTERTVRRWLEEIREKLPSTSD